MQGAGLPVGQGVVGLHGVAVDQRERRGRFHHGGRAGQRGLDVAPGQLAAMGGIVDRGGRGDRGDIQELLAVGDVGLLVDEHIGGEGGGRVGEGGQILVVDPDQLGRIGSLMRGLGHHHRHRLAVVADLVDGKDAVIGHDVAEAEAEMAEIAGGDHRDHAGRGLGLGPVDAGDVGVGPLGANHRGVGHVGHRRVDGVTGPPSDLLPAVPPRLRPGHWTAIREAATVTAVSMGA